jgi:hypothetical protein
MAEGYCSCDLIKALCKTTRLSKEENLKRFAIYNLIKTIIVTAAAVAIAVRVIKR